MSNDLDVIAKRDRLKRVVAITGVGAVGFVAAPFILTAIGGVIGLVVAAGVGVFCVQLAPWVGLKISNLRYRLVDAENVAHIKKVTEAAAENPIETLRLELTEKERLFDEFTQRVKDAIDARDSFKNKVAKFTESYPDRAPEFQNSLARMSALVDQKKTALKAAQEALKDGHLKLDEMTAYWEMAKEADELNKAAGMASGDIFAQLKTQTAYDSVFSAMNKSFADLEIADALSDNSTSS